MHVLQMQMLNTFQGLINMGHNQNNYFTYIYIYIYIYSCQMSTQNTKLKENTFQLTIIYYL